MTPAARTLAVLACFVAVCALLVACTPDAAAQGRVMTECVECSWWNVICKLGNLIDRCPR